MSRSATTTSEPLAAALLRCAAGDRSALKALYDAEVHQMIGVAKRILRRRDLAEEAVHDCFLRIWQHAGSFDAARGDPRSWIYAILRNRALNILRGEARTDLVDDMESMAGEAPEETPEAMCLRLSEERSLRHCLERLEPVRRQAILLAYVNGLSHGEVAGRLGVPLGTTKAWIRRSLMALKDCMA